MSSLPVLNVGILGTTAATESIYIPLLSSLPKHYTLTIIHTNTDLTQNNFNSSFTTTTTTSPDEVINHPDTNLIINLLPFDHHEQYTLAALEAGKHVMVEVPLSLSIHGLRRIRDARKKGKDSTINSNLSSQSGDEKSAGPKVFVGCARRYAPCFTNIFKKELPTLGRVYYARCRNITGPVSVSGPVLTNAPGNGYINGTNTNTNTNRVNNSLLPSSSSARPQRIHALLADIFGSNEDLTRDREAFCRFLGTLGGHDLSLIRESLGFPDAVSNISIIEPFYSAMFHYTDNTRGTEYPFTLVYEAGVDGVPRSDAHLTVYGAKKTLSIEYDFSCESENLAVKVVVEEAICDAVDGNLDVEMFDSSDGKQDSNASQNGHVNGNDVANGNGHSPTTTTRPRMKRTEYVSTARETYEQEFLAMHAYLVGDAGDKGVQAKTTAEDALDDLKLMHMIFDHYDRQCGTIRTPLG